MTKYATIQFVKICCVVLLSFLLLLVQGCGEEGLIDPHGDVDDFPPSSEGLRAVDFPTNNGFAWIYVSADTGQEFTLRIENTREVEGLTHRQMTISEIGIPGDSDSVSREPIDHLSANAVYFFQSDFRIVEPNYVIATYFLKTSQAQIESAFDVINPSRVYHLKHFTPYRLWDFPLEKGKSWTVVEKATEPTARVIRRVLDEGVSVTVPDGNYDAYLVEEEIVGLSEEAAVKQSAADPSQLEVARYEPAKYWVVPDVGVVKYQYNQMIPVTVNQEPMFLLRFFTFELKEKELLDADTP